MCPYHIFLSEQCTVWSFGVALSIDPFAFSFLSTSFPPHICFYSLHLSFSPSSSSFLCFSLPIRKHSGLMVGFKLRYKVIRHWAHFWLLCAFAIAQEAFPPWIWTYSTPQHSKYCFILQHKHCRCSTITKLPKYQSFTEVLMQKTSPPELAERKMLPIRWCMFWFKWFYHTVRHVSHVVQS